MDAWKQARQEEDDYIKNLHNTPLNKEKLSPDGSKEYNQLSIAFDNLQRHYVIGVPESHLEQAVNEAEDPLAALKGHPFEFNNWLGYFYKYNGPARHNYRKQDQAHPDWSLPDMHVYIVHLAPDSTRGIMSVWTQNGVMMGSLNATTAEVIILNDWTRLPTSMGGDDDTGDRARGLQPVIPPDMAT